MNKGYYNKFGYRIGSVCRLCKDAESEFTGEELQMYQYLKTYQADFYLVLDRLDSGKLHVMPVYEAKYQDSKGVSINHRRYWVRFKKLYEVSEKMLEPAAGKYLDYRLNTVSAIYDTHSKAVANDRKIREQRSSQESAWMRYIERQRKECREQERSAAQMESGCCPCYLTCNAKYPYSYGHRERR